MADTKISQLPGGGAIGGTELIEMVQSGANVKLTPADVLTYIQANIIQGTATRLSVDITGLTQISIGGAYGTVFVELGSSNAAENLEKINGGGNADFVYLIAKPGLDVTFRDASLTTGGNLYLDNVGTKTAFGTLKGFMKVFRNGTQFREEDFKDQYV